MHTTELLDSPLDAGRHSPVKAFSYLFIGVLNHYDLIISKLFRCSSVDVEDCLTLVKARREEIDLAVLEERFRETAKYDIADERMLLNWHHFERVLAAEGIYGR